MMDGDISVDTEPGMGSQFTIRIPLYSAQYPAKATVDGLSDKRCWLAVHNASLNDYLTALLTHCGVRVCRYEGQTPDVDDVLIADEMQEQQWQGRGSVLFCRRHIGIPVERARGMGTQCCDAARAVELAGTHLQSGAGRARRRGRIAVTGVSGVGE